MKLVIIFLFNFLVIFEPQFVAHPHFSLSYGPFLYTFISNNTTNHFLKQRINTHFQHALNNFLDDRIYYGLLYWIASEFTGLCIFSGQSGYLAISHCTMKVSAAHRVKKNPQNKQTNISGVNTTIRKAFTKELYPYSSNKSSVSQYFSRDASEK